MEYKFQEDLSLQTIAGESLKSFPHLFVVNSGISCVLAELYISYHGIPTSQIFFVTGNYGKSQLKSKLLSMVGENSEQLFDLSEFIEVNYQAFYEASDQASFWENSSTVSDSHSISIARELNQLQSGTITSASQVGKLYYAPLQALLSRFSALFSFSQKGFVLVTERLDELFSNALVEHPQCVKLVLSESGYASFREHSRQPQLSPAYINLVDQYLDQHPEQEPEISGLVPPFPKAELGIGAILNPRIGRYTAIGLYRLTAQGFNSLQNQHRLARNGEALTSLELQEKEELAQLQLNSPEYTRKLLHFQKQKTDLHQLETMELALKTFNHQDLLHLKYHAYLPALFLREWQNQQEFKVEFNQFVNEEARLMQERLVQEQDELNKELSEEVKQALTERWAALYQPKFTTPIPQQFPEVKADLASYQPPALPQPMPLAADSNLLSNPDSLYAQFSKGGLDLSSQSHLAAEFYTADYIQLSKIAPTYTDKQGNINLTQPWYRLRSGFNFHLLVVDEMLVGIKDFYQDVDIDIPSLATQYYSQLFANLQTYRPRIIAVKYPHGGDSSQVRSLIRKLATQAGIEVFELADDALVELELAMFPVKSIVVHALTSPVLVYAQQFWQVAQAYPEILALKQDQLKDHQDSKQTNHSDEKSVKVNIKTEYPGKIIYANLGVNIPEVLYQVEQSRHQVTKLEWFTRKNHNNLWQLPTNMYFRHLSGFTLCFPADGQAGKFKEFSKADLQQAALELWADPHGPTILQLEFDGVTYLHPKAPHEDPLMHQYAELACNLEARGMVKLLTEQPIPEGGYQNPSEQSLVPQASFVKPMEKQETEATEASTPETIEATETGIPDNASLQQVVLSNNGTSASLKQVQSLLETSRSHKQMLSQLLKEYKHQASQDAKASASSADLESGSKHNEADQSLSQQTPEQILSQVTPASAQFIQALANAELKNRFEQMVAENPSFAGKIERMKTQIANLAMDFAGLEYNLNRSMTDFAQRNFQHTHRHVFVLRDQSSVDTFLQIYSYLDLSREDLVILTDNLTLIQDNPSLSFPTCIDIRPFEREFMRIGNEFDWNEFIKVSDKLQVMVNILTNFSSYSLYTGDYESYLALSLATSNRCTELNMIDCEDVTSAAQAQRALKVLEIYLKELKNNWSNYYRLQAMINNQGTNNQALIDNTYYFSHNAQILAGISIRERRVMFA